MLEKSHYIVLVFFNLLKKTVKKAATEASVIASLQNALGEVHLGNKAGYGDENSSSDED